MLNSLLMLIAVTLVPALELRASIPLGMFGDAKEFLSWPLVALVCVLANIALGLAVFMALGPVFRVLRKWNWFDRAIWPVIERTRHRIHPYVERYGELGVAVFIGIPLPGSGVYTGALGAYLIGIDRRKFAVANVVGVLIAGIAVTLLCLLIRHGFVGDESWMARFFLSETT